MKDCRSVSFCLGATLLVAAQLLTAQSKPLSGADASELAAGKRIFDAQCAWCHGTDGTGGAGPSLQRSDSPACQHRRRSHVDPANGIAGTEMPGFQWSLTDTMTWRTAAYVRSLGRMAGRASAGRSDSRRGDLRSKGLRHLPCHRRSRHGARARADRDRRVARVRVSARINRQARGGASAWLLVVRAVQRAGVEVRGIRVDEDVFWIHVRDADGTLHVLEKTTSAAGGP